MLCSTAKILEYMFRKVNEERWRELRSRKKTACYAISSTLPQAGKQVKTTNKQKTKTYPTLFKKKRKEIDKRDIPSYLVYPRVYKNRATQKPGQGCLRESSNIEVSKRVQHCRTRTTSFVFARCFLCNKDLYMIERNIVVSEYGSDNERRQICLEI
jgi:hypothetical protein